jgi:hypothetical protein
MPRPIVFEAYVGLFEVAAGRPEDGRRLASSVLARGDPDAESVATEAMVEALVGLSDWDSLEEFLPAARATARDHVVLSPFCDRAEGLLQAARGNVGGAGNLLRNALEAFDRLGIAFESARTMEALARVPGENVRELLQRASRTYEELGAAPHAERVRRALGSG